MYTFLHIWCLCVYMCVCVSVCANYDMVAWRGCTAWRVGVWWCGCGCVVPACGVSAAAHLWRPLSIRRVPATAAAAASARAGKKIAHGQPRGKRHSCACWREGLGWGCVVRGVGGQVGGVGCWWVSGSIGGSGAGGRGEGADGLAQGARAKPWRARRCLLVRPCAIFCTASTGEVPQLYSLTPCDNLQKIWRPI